MNRKIKSASYTRRSLVPSLKLKSPPVFFRVLQLPLQAIVNARKGVVVKTRGHDRWHVNLMLVLEIFNDDFQLVKGFYFLGKALDVGLHQSDEDVVLGFRVVEAFEEAKGGENRKKRGF